MKEIWKKYKNHMTDIEVSNFGNIRGIKYNGKPFNDNMIILNKQNRRCLLSEQNPIYLIVWRIFCGNPPKGYDVHHKDHNKLNDRLDNLELMEHGEHSSHHNKGKKWTKEMYELQKIAQTGKHCGKLNPMFGKHHTEESKSKMSEHSKGIKHSNEVKQKMSKQRIGRHWFNDGKNEVFCYKCPEGFSKGRKRK